jgi:hypothetical protein
MIEHFLKWLKLVLLSNSSSEDTTHAFFIIKKHVVKPMCKPLNFSTLQWYHYSGFLVGLVV